MTDAADKIRQGDLRALARAATGVENRDPESLAVLAELAPFAGHARIVGITGPPGAGKSTLMDALAMALRERGQTVAVLAIDPSSRITGGAILGDRIRMSRHYADPGIFIRSMATRGEVGGLAAATGDMALLMDAAGRDYVLIETVGVGQDEIEIAGLADINVVVQAPGMGDDVQAIKAGILEIADVFVVNKADQPGAARVEQELHAAFSLAEGPQPPIVLTVATEGKGLAKLLDVLSQLPLADRSRDRQGALVPWPDATILHHAVAFYARPGMHVRHVRVPNLAAAAAELGAAGGSLLNQPPESGPVHLYVVLEPASARAVLLELTQSQESAS
jgi:LAO/AO transport system kinase